jgi:hypothetical protein
LYNNGTENDTFIFYSQMFLNYCCEQFRWWPRTKFMVQGLSWAVEIYSAFPHCYWILRFIIANQECITSFYPETVQSSSYPHTTYLFKQLHFNIIYGHTWLLQSVSFHEIFRHKHCVHYCYLRHNIRITHLNFLLSSVLSELLVESDVTSHAKPTRSWWSRKARRLPWVNSSSENMGECQVLWFSNRFSATPRPLYEMNCSNWKEHLMQIPLNRQLWRGGPLNFTSNTKINHIWSVLCQSYDFLFLLNFMNKINC